MRSTECTASLVADPSRSKSQPRQQHSRLRWPLKKHNGSMRNAPGSQNFRMLGSRSAAVYGRSVVEVAYKSRWKLLGRASATILPAGSAYDAGSIWNSRTLSTFESEPTHKLHRFSSDLILNEANDSERRNTTEIYFFTASCAHVSDLCWSATDISGDVALRK